MYAQAGRYVVVRALREFLVAALEKELPIHRLLPVTLQRILGAVLLLAA